MECVLKTVADKEKHFFVTKYKEYKCYKDEGGKWWIEIKVTNAPLVQKQRCNTIELAVLLDNGKSVKQTERDDFTLRDKRPIVDIEEKRVSWCIRFNKVTRRKDGYKYKIRITINGKTVVAPLVECLSKRKIPVGQLPRRGEHKSRKRPCREQVKNRAKIRRFGEHTPAVMQVVPIDLESFIHDIVDRRIRQFKQEWLEKEVCTNSDDDDDRIRFEF